MADASLAALDTINRILAREDARTQTKINNALSMMQTVSSLESAASQRQIATQQLLLAQEDWKRKETIGNLELLSAQRETALNQGGLSFYNNSGLAFLYGSHYDEDEDDLGQSDAIKELVKKRKDGGWGLNQQEANNIVSTVWGYNQIEFKQANSIAQLAAKLNNSLEAVNKNKATEKQKSFALAFQKSGYYDKDNEESLNTAMNNTGQLERALEVGVELQREIDELATGHKDAYVISPKARMRPDPVKKPKKADPLPDIKLGSTFTNNQLQLLGLAKGIDQTLPDGRTITIDDKGKITNVVKPPKQVEVSTELEDAMEVYEGYRDKVISYNEESYGPALEELEESYWKLANIPSLKGKMPGTSLTSALPGVGGFSGGLQYEHDVKATPTEDDLENLKSSVSALSKIEEKWYTPSSGIGPEVVTDYADYIGDLNDFLEKKKMYDNLTKLEAEAHANMSAELLK